MTWILGVGLALVFAGVVLWALQVAYESGRSDGYAEGVAEEREFQHRLRGL